MRPALRTCLLLLTIVSLTACNGGTPDGDTDTGHSGDTGLGAPAGGGLTVPEALETDATGPLTVQGFLIDEAGSVQLCQVVMESYPPQCGGDSLKVEGLDVASLEEATTEGDVSWVDQVALTGELEDGTLIVSETSP